MTPILKKTLIIISSIFVVVFTSLLILPYLLRDKIMVKAKSELNRKLNAKVDFEGINISFIRNFPNASVKLENFYIVGVDEFAQDTLIRSGDINLILNMKSLFSETGYYIQNLEFNDSKVLIHILKNGKANWDILKTDTTQAIDTSALNFHFKLKDFVIHRADILYLYEKEKIKFELINVNHSTTGDLTADSSLLVTKTKCDSLSFIWGDIAYISKAKAEIYADIDANLNAMIFKISKNSSRINELPFSFEGWLKSINKGWDMDLSLNAESVDFRGVLSVIPAMYAGSFHKIKTGGKVFLSGFAKGQMIGDFYPAFNFKLNVLNGWFQYPSLPKSLQKINFDCIIFNPGKTLDETVFDISKFSFDLGGNPFSAKINVAHPMSDPDLKLNAAGKVNLGMIKEVYPLSKNTLLNGQMDMQLDLAGRMSYYEKNQYDKYKFSGKFNVINMLAKSNMLPQDIAISKASVVFNNRYLDLTALHLKIGKNDISATGKIENFIGYTLSDKLLLGKLNLQSTYFNLSDFMPQELPETDKKVQAVKPVTDKSSLPSNSKPIQIPRNIDFIMQASFDELMYDKMKFTNAKGQLIVSNGEFKIRNLTSNAFGGNLIMNGLYTSVDSLKHKVDFNISVQEVAFAEIFKQVGLLQKFAPIFEKASGKFSTKLSFNSLLKTDMMPVLTSIIGSGALDTKLVGLKNVPVIDALATALNRNDLAPMIIKDLGLLFEIKEGNLITKPFNFKVGDIKLNVGGATRLDKTINYAGIVQLPDKFNLGKLSTLNLKIGGTFSKPKIEVDLKAKVKEVLTETATKVESEIKKQVDDAKEKSIEEVRKQKEKAMQIAQQQADKLLSEAKKAGGKLIEQAKIQGDNLIAKATNPIAKKAAELLAKKLVVEATKKAEQLIVKAQEESKILIEKAGDEVKI